MKKKNSLKISCGVLVRLYLSHYVHLNIFQTEEKKKNSYFGENSVE